MPVTGLYFIPETTQTATLSKLIDHLTKRYQSEPIGRWGLEHRLFRETAPSTSSTADEKGNALRYLQFLSLTHQPGRSYVGISAPKSGQAKEGSAAEAAAVIAIPQQGQSDELVQLIITKFGPLWSHRQMLQVTNGSGYEVEDFRIRVGEVRQGHGGQARGVVVEIGWLAGDNGEGEAQDSADWEMGQAVIRAFWEKLEVPNGREYIAVPGVGTGKGMDLERQYFDLLRLRG